MTTTVAAKGGHQPRAGTLLAAAEMRRMARHPLLAVGAVLSALLFWRETHEYAPVLQRDSVYIAKALVPFAVSGLFAASLTALRDRRLGADEVLDALHHGPDLRFSARTAAAAVPVAYAALLAFAFYGVLRARGGVGAVALPEIAIGVACVAAATVAGGVVSRYVPSPLAPLGLTLVLVTATLLLASREGARSRWLAPFVDFSSRADAIEIARRPAALHAAALTAATAALVAAAVLRPRAVRLVAASVLAIAAVGLAAAQLRGASSRDIASATSFALQPHPPTDCQGDAGVRVCLYPGYRGWGDDHLAVARSVLSDVPTGTRQLTLEQRPPRLLKEAFPPHVVLDVNRQLAAAPGPDTVVVGMTRESGTGFDLRLAIGMWAVGGPAAPAAGERRFDSPSELEGSHPPDVYCSVAGQARGTVALWLAVRDDAAARDELADLAALAGDPVGGAGYLVTAGGAVLSPQQALLAVDLARMPADVVTERVLENWDTFVSPGFDVARLAGELGVGLPEAGVGAPVAPMGADRCR